VWQAWVQFGVPLEECGQLLERLLAAVHDDELSDVALDALSSMVSIMHKSYAAYSDWYFIYIYLSSYQEKFISSDEVTELVLTL
jgi:hypothetical protein